MAETFILRGSSNFTTSSVRLAINQGVLPADFLEERYYLFDSYYDGAEPSRTPDAVITGSASYVDFSGLAPGRMWHVQAWRRYTNVQKAHLKASYSTSSPSEYTALITLADSYTIDPTVKTYSISTASAAQFRSQWNMRNVRHKFYNDAQMGDYVRFDVTNGTTGWLQGLQIFNRTKPISIKCKIRTYGNPWWGFGLYSAETEDTLITHHVGNSNFAYSYNLPWFDTAISIVSGTIYDLEVRWDGVGVTSFYVNGSKIGQITHVRLVDTKLYMGATTEGAGAGAYVDFSSVSITGEEVGGFHDHSTYLWDTDNACAVYGAEWGHGYSSTQGTPHFYQQGGGFTVAAVSPALLLDGMGIAGAVDVESYHAGTAVIRSPKYYPADGFKYKSLRLIGSTMAGGSLVTKVYDGNGNIVSNTQIPNNSVGFTPTYGSELSVDLTGVTTTPISFVTTITNPTEGVTDYNTYPTNNSGPPILRALSVDFTTGSISLTPSLSFNQQPTSANGVVYYGTQDLTAVTGILVQNQPVQVELFSAKQTIYGTITNNQAKQTSNSVVREIYNGTNTTNQNVQTSYAIGSELFSGSIVGNQVKQTVTSFGSSGVTTLAFDEQPTSVDGIIYYSTEDLTVNVYEASVIQLTKVQQQIATGALGLAGVVNQTQQNTENINASQIFTSVVSSTSFKNNQTSLGELSFTGALFQTSNLNVQNIFADSDTKSALQQQDEQQQSITSSLIFTGYVTAQQAFQSQISKKISNTEKYIVTAYDPLKLRINSTETLQLKISSSDPLKLLIV